MALWFKRKEEPILEEVKALPEISQTSMLSFNKDELWKKVQDQWVILYDLKGETGWKLVMAQIERIKNIYILDMNMLNKRENLDIEYARQQGRIEALVQFERLVETELKKIKQLEETKGKQKNGERTIIKDSRRLTRQKAGPSLAI